MTVVARFGYRYKDVRSAACTSNEEVGNCVYESANSIDGIWQVRNADPTDVNKFPCVGVIISKPTSTTCVIQCIGETENIYSGINFGKPYYLGRNSKPSYTAPIPSGDEVFLQVIGYGVDSDKLYVVPPSGVRHKRR